jgi:hypothetical protein
MGISSLCRDTISLIKPDGTITENIKASVRGNLILIADEKLPLEENDEIYRKLPSGLVEKYVVIDRGYHSRIGGIEGHYQAQVRKEGSIDENKYQSIINIYNASGPSARINISSTDLSKNYFNNPDFLFKELKSALDQINEQEIKEKALNMAEEMEKAKHTSTFIEKYKNFIVLLKNHMEIIAPFIPALTELLK